MARVLCICNWQRFQHYKDRDPPWVKFYRDMLTSESWVLGTDHSRLVQAASILLAARYGNRIPYRFDLVKKVASLDLSEPEFHAAIEHLSATNFLEVQEVTEPRKPAEQIASAALASCTSEKRREETEAEKRERESARARAREGPEVSRGTPGVIDCGTALTQSPESAWAGLLEDWRRDVPGVNQDAFARWIVHVESLGKPMHAAMRLGQAKRLAGNGDAAAQAEVVQFCIEQGYRSLIPIADVRARTRGMSRAPPDSQATTRTWRPKEEAGAGG